MGREVRKVPASWEHPKNETGDYVPLYDGQSLARRTNRWDEEKAMWSLGFRRHFVTNEWVPLDDSNTNRNCPL